MSKNIQVLVGGNYVGGAEKVTLDVLDGLKKQGHSLHCIINGWNDGDFQNQLKKFQIPFATIKLGWMYWRKPLWTLDSLLHLPGALWKYFKQTRSHTSNWIYATSYRQLVLLYPLIQSPVILHVHDPSSNSRQAKLALKIIDKKIHTYIAVSKFIKNDLIRCGIQSEKIKVVYNGIDLPDSPLKSANQDSTFTLGIVGQLIERKGHEDLIDALHLIVAQGYHNIKLCIVGRGDPNFIAHIHSKITTLNLNEVVEWRTFKVSLQEIYENIDIVVAPTRSEEPFGLVAIEGNALGLPVIVSNRGGLSEIVEHGYNGWIVEAGSPQDLARAIIFCAQNKAQFAEIGANGRKKVELYFSKTIMIDKIHQIVENDVR